MFERRFDDDSHAIVGRKAVKLSVEASSLPREARDEVSGVFAFDDMGSEQKLGAYVSLAKRGPFPRNAIRPRRRVLLSAIDQEVNGV